MAAAAHTVDDIRRIVTLDHGLASVSTRRDGGGIHVTLVNAGIIDHPDGSGPVAAFVSRPATVKLGNLRRDPTATLHWRAGWAWVAAEGTVELRGPDDPVGAEDLPALLRAIYEAAGGEHEDWAEFDRAMAAERRVAVLLRPERIYVNP